MRPHVAVIVLVPMAVELPPLKREAVSNDDEGAEQADLAEALSETLAVAGPLRRLEAVSMLVMMDLPFERAEGVIELGIAEGLLAIDSRDPVVLRSCKRRRYPGR
jgi:hypothetical protein